MTEMDTKMTAMNAMMTVIQSQLEMLIKMNDKKPPSSNITSKDLDADVKPSSKRKQGRGKTPYIEGAGVPDRAHDGCLDAPKKGRRRASEQRRTKGVRPNTIANLFVILPAVVLVICVTNLVWVWRTIQHDLEDIARSQHPAAIDPEKRHAYRLLRDAGVLPVAAEVVARLPRWSDIVAQYGPKPILDLEHCAAYRSAVPQEERIAGVAGLFNTGTNLLANLMTRNCHIDRPRGSGMRMQVPWGKHNPPTTHRLKNVAQAAGKGVNQTAVFPLVVIKDPYHWAVSQCRHRYFTNWKHSSNHCPNIVDWRSHAPVNATVLFALGKVRYKTLLDLWSSWYGEYETQASHFPLAYLRFEDLLFHGEEVVTKLCDCVGGRRQQRKFHYPQESVKTGMVGIGSGTNGLIDAMIRYGDPRLRLEGWTERDWAYAVNNLDEALMDKYSYIHPEWNS